MPVTGGTSVVAFLSASGIPPLAGFWSKLLIIMALWMANFQWAAILALLASILTLAYFLILQRNTFFGKPSVAHSTLTEADPHLTVPALLLAAITVVTGILMPFVIVYMNTRGFL
jgi:multicomponent Na+:H+ antiporter subunit D